MTTLFVLDIDGTLADATRRFKEAGPEPLKDDREAYDSWVARVQNEQSLAEDKSIAGMQSLAWALSHYSFSRVVYLTSREEQWRLSTRTWLGEHGFPTVNLFMRGDGNYSETADFKEICIDAVAQAGQYSNVVVVDDDQDGSLEKTCKRRGWTFLKARSGGGDVHE